MRDRLVRADRPTELLATLRMLDTELERMAGDPDRLEGECGKRASPSACDDLRRSGRCREEAGVVVLEDDTAETTRRIDGVKDLDVRPGVLALREVEADAVGPACVDNEGVDVAGVGNEARLTT